MRPGIGSNAALPIASLVAAGSLDTVAVVAGGVVVVLALLACALVLRKGVAPWLEWGSLRAGVAPVSDGSSRRPQRDADLTDEPAPGLRDGDAASK